MKLRTRISSVLHFLKPPGLIDHAGYTEQPARARSQRVHVTWIGSQLLPLPVILHEPEPRHRRSRGPVDR